MKKNEVNMLSGSIAKGLLTIALPIMAMNVLQSLFNIIDMTLLGMLVGDNPVGAVGTCGSLISLFTGLLIGISAGANVVVAKFVGIGDEERVQRAIGTSLFFAIISGIALMIFGVVFAKPLLILINCPDSLLSKATIYFQLYFLGVPLLLIYNFSASILRSVGSTKRPMYYMTIGGILKVFLNFIIIYFLKLDVEGVAIATIISWTFASIFCLKDLLKNKGIAQFKFKHFRFYWKELSNVLFIGIPAGLEQAMYSIANVVITSTVNAVGPEATKGISIANQYDGIMYQIAIAPSYAIMAYVSQNIGAKNPKRAEKSVLTAIGFTTVIGLSFGLLMATCSTPLTWIMSKNPTVIKYSRQKMLLISPTYFICGINAILAASLRGMEKPIIPTVSIMVFMCLIRFPWVWFVYPILPNLTFLYLIWPIGWILSSLTLTAFCIPAIKKKKTEVSSINLQVQ